MTARVAQTGMDEKSQVVSFLLREYEDTDADWLFELDTGRRLRSVTPRLAFALSRELDEIEGRPAGGREDEDETSSAADADEAEANVDNEETVRDTDDTDEDEQ